MAAVIAKPWTFSQVSGKRPDQTLFGWNAPFGRPRQGAIVNAGVSIRRSITYYTDGDTGPTPPTVHAFGTEPKPFELHGRWMDRSIGAHQAVRSMQRSWVDFVTDKDLVTARWGDILSYVIFIHDIDLKYESESDIAWELKADVIRDDQAPATLVPVPIATPIDFANQMVDPMQRIETPVSLNLKALLGEIADQIDNIVTSLQAPFAAVYNIATAIGDFETALSSDLVKMASSLQIMKTGIIELRDANELAIARFQTVNQQAADLFASPDNPGFLRSLLSGPDQVNIASKRISDDRDTANLLALIADMQAAIRGSQRGQALTAHPAQTGDTWESISTRIFGGPDGARAIKDMNGIRYGQRPQPGKIYQIPRTP